MDRGCAPQYSSRDVTLIVIGVTTPKARVRSVKKHFLRKNVYRVALVGKYVKMTVSAVPCVENALKPVLQVL